MPKQRSNINMAEPLKYWRTKRGYSQSKLAMLAETSALTISQLESGKRKARGKTLDKILSGLKISRNEFFNMREAADISLPGGTISGEALGSETGTASGAGETASSVKLSNLDLEILNRMLNLDFEGKLETLRFLQSLK